LTITLLLAAALAAAGFTAQAEDASAPPPVEPSAAAVPAVVVPQPILLPKGTMVRLMVTKEVNSRDRKAGDRFTLRVDEDVKVGGVTLIPVGATGWGEVVNAEGSGGVGKRGRINAKLLFVDANGKRIALDGQRQTAGSNATGAVVYSVLAFGPLGLLMKGGNATLKAGEILNGYTVEDVAFEAPKP
jgi:hypothetical protein